MSVNKALFIFFSLILINKSYSKVIKKSILMNIFIEDKYKYVSKFGCE
jgi:MFS-type transporter involved in bile tolerance (Atg22 family)